MAMVTVTAQAVLAAVEALPAEWARAVKGAWAELQHATSKDFP
jgi:hypothetical protein